MQKGDGLSLTERHLSFYRYFSLAEPIAPLREEVKLLCARHGLRGTIVLSREGVNGMLAGNAGGILAFRSFAFRRFGIPESGFKEMSSPSGVFSRLLVKEKRELSSVGAEGLRPWEQTAKRLAPSDLRKWLDEGRPLVLLDARNSYEVEVGTFEGAQHLGIDSSRDFTAEAEKRMAQWAGQTVVTFCTGGIRCEKAAAQLERLGVAQVYQLDGGILRYFEECGGEHFRGSCFVFDWRMAVDSQLLPVGRPGGAEREFGRHKLAPARAEVDRF